MQEKIKINGIEIQQPTYDGYAAVLSTTSTDDSDRDMSLDMHNTPIGTVVGYNLKWEDISAEEVAKILQQVLNKSSFTVHYFDIVTATWKDGEFYASNFNAPSRSLEEGAEKWDELSFNIIGVKPV